MTIEDQISAIRRFIEWREESGDISGLEVSLDVYAAWLAEEERRTLAQRGLDILGQTHLTDADLDELRVIMKAAL